MTWIVLWFTDKTVGLRVGDGERAIGLDLGEHGKNAYDLPAHSPQDAPVKPAAFEPGLVSGPTVGQVGLWLAPRLSPKSRRRRCGV